MKCGTLLIDDNYQFGNGSVIDKILIYICPFGYNCLVVPATSRQHYKKRVPGCQPTNNPHNFFIPAGGWFQKDTWIESNAVNEYDEYIMEAKLDDKVLRVQNVCLPAATMREIIDCILTSDDVDGMHLDQLAALRAKLV